MGLVYSLNISVMSIVIVQYVPDVGASICVYDDIPATVIDRLSAAVETGGLFEGSVLMTEFYDTYGCGKELAHPFIHKTPGWMMSKNKCAVFQVYGIDN